VLLFADPSLSIRCPVGIVDVHIYILESIPAAIPPASVCKLDVSNLIMVLPVCK